MMMPNVTPAIALAAEKLATLNYTFTTEDGIEQTVNALDAARAIVATKGQNKNRLRASKPKLDERVVRRTKSYQVDGRTRSYTSDYRDTSLATGAAAQVWRWVAFSLVFATPYSCIPCTVDFDSPFDMNHEESRRFGKWCEQVADLITSKMPVREQQGVLRWGRALGYDV